MNLPLSSVFGAGASYVSGDIIMNTEISEETIINFVNVFKILYQVAQREHPEWFIAANDNRKSTSDIDTEYDYNGHKGEES